MRITKRTRNSRRKREESTKREFFSEFRQFTLEFTKGLLLTKTPYTFHEFSETVARLRAPFRTEIERHEVTVSD
jgi:hypothetical protein